MSVITIASNDSLTNECWQKLLDFEHFSFTPLDFFNIFLN